MSPSPGASPPAGDSGLADAIDAEAWPFTVRVLILELERCSDAAGGCDGCPVMEECCAAWNAWIDADGGESRALWRRRRMKLRAFASRARLIREAEATAASAAITPSILARSASF